MSPEDEIQFRLAVNRIVDGLLAILALRTTTSSSWTHEPSRETPTLDPRPLERLRASCGTGRPDGMPELVDAFAAEGQGLIETLRVAIAGGCDGPAARAAEALHWASRNVGAARMASLAAALRAAVLAADRDRVALLVAAAPEELDRVRAVLSERLR